MCSCTHILLLSTVQQQQANLMLLLQLLWQLVGQDVLQNDCWRLYLFIDSPMRPCLCSTFSRGYGVLVGYFVNHPLYTPPMLGDAQVYTGLALFLFNEYGNFVIHCALRDLRPPGTKERKIPYPTSHPLTQLFRFVFCPNYTYEAGSWIVFSVMTQTLTAVLFTLFGFYQMAVWAIGKHRNYRKEFKDYPKGRKAIVPFLL
ncbi:unnamed protein product [Porites lobata]|uniref:3-oxo-5-alpha-steroid 4-dehydrogenase C-terminal domain-containing protein n=1 Tax=Porites lobata TaxID=104759 RepID=A0ABN8RCW2_9CNID|nr:unnamed protein product [Porites lobata]